MVTINRKDLYKKVWETLITRLSKGYGLYESIHKGCFRVN